MRPSPANITAATAIPSYWSKLCNVRSALIALLLCVTSSFAQAQYCANNNTAVSWDIAVTYNSGSSFATWTVAANSSITINVSAIVSVRVRCTGTTCTIAADGCTGRVWMQGTGCNCSSSSYSVRFDHCIDPTCSSGSCNTGSNAVTISNYP